MPAKEMRTQEAGSNTHTYQKETKNDTAYEQPLSDIKRDIKTTILTLTVIEDLIRPCRGGQHRGCRKDIRDIHEK